ncbi:hypothetical protein QYE76_062491 [Lolium multiflorum]|uniref:NAC domain-containing protein n=1 Tax=Lolium multiflorum TaxID=4521 RepID=A0AAD8W5Q2_LOLMU|nr:hypothetical protein QYE76_062491 [Lolium multiflorum]
MQNAPATRGVMEETNKVVVDNDDGRNRHGFPWGYHFVPKPIELIGVLDDKRAGRRLPYPPNIFHDVKILDHHPADLYNAYRGHEEAGFIYFFSRRVFPEPRGRRTNPVRAAKGGTWKASGGGKPVKRHRVDVGVHNTLAFYQKTNNPSGLTEWGMHEYATVIGRNGKVADLALYRIYKKKKGEKEEEGEGEGEGEEEKAGQNVAPVSNGLSKLEELPSPCPAASTSQAQASVGQAHDYYHQGAFRDATSALEPGSSWVTLISADSPGQLHAGCMGQTGSPPAPLTAPSLQVTTENCSPISPLPQLLSLQALSPMSPQHLAINDFALADWDNMLLLPPSPPAAFAHGLPTPQQQDAEYPGPADSNELLKMLQPPTLPAPDSQGCQDDEFKVWPEMQPATSPCWFPMPGDDELPMLTDEENKLSLDELLAGLRDEAAMSAEKPATNDQ